MEKPMQKKIAAEFIGTFWLVLGGCGSAVLAAAFPHVGIGLLGVSLAFGLTVLTMAYAIGHISGCHLNPAVSVGLWAGGRFPAKELLPYIVAQVLGGLAAAGTLYLIATGKADFDVAGGFAANGFGEHSPGGYTLGAALVTEVVMTMIFLFVIMGSTDRRAPAGLAPIAIGLCLTLIHLISIPVTNTSVNPARSTAVAVFVGDWALAQLWLFWVAPIVGGALGAVIYRYLVGTTPSEAAPTKLADAQQALPDGVSDDQPERPGESLSGSCFVRGPPNLTSANPAAPTRWFLQTASQWDAARWPHCEAVRRG